MMQLAFGTWFKELDAERAQAVLNQARIQQTRLQRRSLETVLEVIDRVGQAWTQGSGWHQKAMAQLPEELSFSPEMIEASLRWIPVICSREYVEQKLRAELGDLAILDGFSHCPDFVGRLRAIPRGVLLQVSAGNIFLGAIDSLVNALITKNVSILRLSARNQGFPMLFAQSIEAVDRDRIWLDAFALIHWDRTDKDTENLFKKNVAAVVAWGGQDMVESYRAGLPAAVPLIAHGPKISFQVLSKKCLSAGELDTVAAGIAREVCLWDQSACASPQNLFVEEGVLIPALVQALSQAFVQTEWPRGRMEPDEQVEFLKEHYRAKLTALTEGGAMAQGADYLIHFDPAPGMRPSALNRCLIVKKFRDVPDLCEQLHAYGDVLQSCSYGLLPEEESDYLEALAFSGVKRFAPLGTVMDGVVGAPHDGQFPLRELLQFIGDERSGPHSASNTMWEQVQAWIQQVPFYRELYRFDADPQVLPILASRRFTGLIPIQGSDLAGEWEEIAKRFILPSTPEGHVFSSGGTSGAPKYALFTDGDLDRVAALLAKGYRAQGLVPGTLCANLFVPGNLWSSFLAIDRALTKAQVRQLGIGGTADPRYILEVLQKFQPQVVFGLPSLLLDLAQKSREWGISLAIPKVVYAGEHLSLQAREYLRTHWQTREFFSAGYASVDAGPIGYQCRHSVGREHHLFAEQVHLELLDGEAVVTSLVRQAMPVVHLRTGDHVEWVENQALCGCGSSDRRFVLHGRMDGQIRIWSCRLLLEEVEQAWSLTCSQYPVFQLELVEDSSKGLKEILRLKVEIDGGVLPTASVAESFVKNLHACSKDVAQTWSVAELATRIQVLPMPVGGLERVARTGKVRKIVDQRRI